MKAVVLNDTRPNAHHGCTRVMDVLAGGLARAGVAVSATSPVRHAWWRDRRLLACMAEADAIVINGEGSLHHARPAAARLLEITDHPVARDRPVFLVNALYQQNPADWARWLSPMAGIWARDSRSAAEISAALGREVPWLPDLTLATPGVAGARPPSDAPVVFGDSVDDDVSAELARLASASNAPILPALAHPGGRPPARGAAGLALARFRRAAREVRLRRSRPGLAYARTPEDYAARLSRAGLYVTGRFHGVCYSLLTGTPFLAVVSNSWKIEALIADVGLRRNRLVPLADLPARLADGRDWRFADDERKAIRACLVRARRGAETMFTEIAVRTRGTQAG